MHKDVQKYTKMLQKYTDVQKHTKMCLERTSNGACYYSNHTSFKAEAFF